MVRALAILLVVSSVAGLGFLYLRSKGVRQVQAEPGAADRQSAAGAAKSQTGPKAIAEETFHQFGILDPAEPCKYTFFVRNDGEVPLKIRKGGTSCKCTVSMLPAEDIPPGKKGPVEIASKMDQTEGEFTHSATFHTNDPANPTITLTIAGAVRKHIAASPSALVLTSLRRGETKKVDAIVYSQVWDQFAVEDLKASLEGMTWQVEPAPAESLEPLKARSGYRLQLTLPADLPFGNFAERLSMTIRPDGSGEEPRPFELPVSGSVPGRRTVYGEKIDYQGVVTLGPLRPGEGAETHLTMNLRDEPHAARVLRVEKEADFLAVDVSPYKPGTDKVGIYKIDIKVPRDAPTCNYMGYRAAKLKIVLDHPTVPEVDLKVQFAVLSR
jgi:hypothetical protein